MNILKEMGRETSNRGISAGPLENLGGLHAAIEVAIFPRRLLNVAISSGHASTHVKIRTNRHVGAVHVNAIGAFLYSPLWAAISQPFKFFR